MKLQMAIPEDIINKKILKQVQDIGWRFFSKPKGLDLYRLMAEEMKWEISSLHEEA